jgi:hypothetical protein
MDRPPTHAGHALDPDEASWGARFSLVMSLFSIALVVVLVLLASRT